MTSVAATTARAASGQPEGQPAAGPEEQDLILLTAHALRNLGNPAALAQSGLIARLPRTIRAARAATADAAAAASMTPLDQAKLLSVAIIAVVEKFNLTAGQAGGGTEAEQYVILHEKYVQKKRISAILTRHNISESAFHRWRREGIRALAADLAAQEENLSKEAVGNPS